MPILVVSAVARRSGFATHACLTQIQIHHTLKSPQAPEGSIADHRVVPPERQHTGQLYRHRVVPPILQLELMIHMGEIEASQWFV